MVSSRHGNGGLLTEALDENASPTPNHEVLGAAGFKRKADDTSPDEENKENSGPGSWSKSRKLNDAGEKKPHGPPRDERKDAQEVRATIEEVSEKDRDHTEMAREHTPGRDGPIKEEDRSAFPDIKPFKGPPGKKVRKTAWEKNEEYKQFIRETPGHVFHELYVCFDKGPNSSPTYDKSGFQLDYNKVAEWMKPKAYNKSRMVNGMEKAIAKSKSESEQMAEIFFEKGEAPTDSWKVSQGCNYWKDRVSKDLNVPWHKITVEHFREWERRGFRKARRGEYENPREEEQKRMTKLMSGASLRK